MTNEAITRAMRHIVGRRWVLDGRLDRALYAYDAGSTGGLPDVVVMPGTRAETVDVVKAAADMGLPIIPRGAGTCLSGGPVPVRGGIVLAMNRLNRILSLDPIGRTAVVEPGVINSALQEAAAQHNLGFMPDPASQAISTLGGNAAENAGGPRTIKHGVFRRHLAGLEWVCGDGTIVTTGALARDASDAALVPGEMSVSGLNLDALIVGSEGTLGVITQLALRLAPLAAARSTVLALYAVAEGAGRTVAALAGANLAPAAVEIMGGLDIRLADEHLSLGIPAGIEAMLLIEFDGPGPSLPRLAQQAAAVARECGAVSVDTANDPPERDRLWRARRSATGYYGRIRPAYLSGDVTVPRSQVPALFNAIARIERKHGRPIGLIGHAGDGNLHPAILFDPADEAEMNAAHAANQAVIAAVLAMGGSLTGEHGVGIEKLPYMGQAFTEPVLRAFRAVKQAFDPAGRLNPGKAIPNGPNDATQTGVVPPAAVRLADHRWQPPAVAYPESVDEIAQIIALARAGGVRVCPTGSGQQVRTAPCGRDDVLELSLQRMDRIIAVRADDLYCEVQPGCSAVKLTAALSALREAGGPALSYSVEAARRVAGTLGGEVAVDIRGPGWRRHGPTHEQVLGLTWVNALGEVCEVGSRTLKDVAGYDLTRLLCGSRGALGVIAGIRLRLHPAPESAATAVAACLDAASANELAHRLRTEVDVEYVEVLPAGLHDGPTEGSKRPAVILAVAGPREDTDHWIQLSRGMAAECGAQFTVLAGQAADEAQNAALRSYAARTGATADQSGLSAHTTDEPAARLTRRLKQLLDPDGLFIPATPG